MRALIRRLLAFMIDWVVLFAVFALPQAIIALFVEWPISYGTNTFVGWGWVLLTVSLPSWLYFTLSDSSSGGATVGKRVLGLSVREVDGERLPRRRALLRTAVKLLPWEMTHIMVFFPEPFGEELTPGKIVLLVIVDVLLLVWLVAPWLDRPRYRALHDRAAGSEVQPM